MNTDTSTYKEKLQAEREVVEEQLQKIGVKNNLNPNAWEAAEKDLNDEEPSDRTETAETLTEYGDDVMIVNSLKARLMEINDALEAIEQGKHGICKVCIQNIENDRLDANPAASTCKAHMNA